MATFRYKPDKVKYLNIVKTLDETHQNFATDFYQKRTNLPEKISELNKLKKKLDYLSSNKIEITDEIIRNKSNLKEQIKQTEREIENIKNGKEEIEYYSKTSDILMDYYNLIENDGEDVKKNDIINLQKDDKNNSEDLFDSDDNTDTNEKLKMINKISQLKRKEKRPTKKRIKNVEDMNNNNSKNILAFFSSLKKNTESEQEVTETNDIESEVDQETKKNTEINGQSTCEKVVSNRASLFDMYMSIIDKKYASDKVKPNYIKMCTQCNTEKTLIQSEGMFVCTKCGETEHVIIESEIPNHKETGNEKPRTPYKKQTHLAETLNQFQAKESTEIPPKVYNGIIAELKKFKITNEELVEMKYSKAKILIKQILKKLRFTTFYEHIPFILSKITNKPAPTISRETEEIIKRMFKQTEEPFIKYCPRDRKNFLNYSYVFHKFFEILDMPEFADCFPLLKSRDKLKKADDAWEKICKELNWTFYPSV
jgi:hypothetical protein